MTDAVDAATVPNAFLAPLAARSQEEYAKNRSDVFKKLRRDRQQLAAGLAQLHGPPIRITNVEDHAAAPEGTVYFVNGYVKADGVKLPRPIDLPGCTCPPGQCPLPGCSCFKNAVWERFADNDKSATAPPAAVAASKPASKSSRATRAKAKARASAAIASTATASAASASATASRGIGDIVAPEAPFPAELAYHPDGRAKDEVLRWSFRIFECNHLCACGDGCVNKVTSRGRQIPLELFKTALKGWGVRTLVGLPKGTFVGLYNGEIVDEDMAEMRGQYYEEAGKTYLYDLDAFVDSNAFTIDATVYGDISRFFSHSCEPTMVCLGIVRANQRRIYHHSFFTNRDVAAGEELCFDYDPQWHRKQAAGGRASGPCHCGQKACRKFIFWYHPPSENEDDDEDGDDD